MNPIAAHAIPFGAWIALMHFLDVPQLPPALAYAIRTAVCLVLLFICRPWRWYERPDFRNIPLALAAGIFVLLAWVGLEAGWMDSFPGIRDGYVKLFILPFGKLREPLTKTPYAPEVCGWTLSMIRLLGSGLVIAAIEEFFWRGFIYRWLLGLDFTQVKHGHFSMTPFLITACIFGAEHQEWLAGIVAGLVYGWLYVRTRDLWSPILAHMVTNLLLGVYVLKTGQYFFW